MLFHAGIPRPEEGIPVVTELLRTTTRLCERIVDRCRKEEGTRQQAVEMIPKVVPGEQETIVRNALHTLIDGIGQSKTLDLGILAFSSCWGVNSTCWCALSADRLERLFEVETREPADVTYTVECDRAIISTTSNSLATFHGEPILISGTYKLPIDELLRYSWSLALMYRRGVLETQDLEASEGSYSFLLETETAFSRYRSALPLKLELLANQECRAEARLKLHLCGPVRPAFVLVEAGFQVIDADTHSEEEIPDKKIESNEPSHVYLFSHSGQEPILLDADENELSTIETGHEGIWRSSEKVDPLDDPSGQVIRICQFDSLATTICFEAKDIEKGEFTVEDELRVQITGKRESNLKDLVAIFSGESR